jgi:hypothetical protein
MDGGREGGRETETETERHAHTRSAAEERALGSTISDRL